MARQAWGKKNFTQSKLVGKSTSNGTEGRFRSRFFILVSAVRDGYTRMDGVLHRTEYRIARLNDGNQVINCDLCSVDKNTVHAMLTA